MSDFPDPNLSEFGSEIEADVSVWHEMIKQEIRSPAHAIVAYLKLMLAHPAGVPFRKELEALLERSTLIRDRVDSALEIDQLHDLISEERDESPRSELSRIAQRLRWIMDQQEHYINGQYDSEWRTDLRLANDAAMQLLNLLDRMRHTVNTQLSTQLQPNTPSLGIGQHQRQMISVSHVLEHRAQTYAKLNMTGRILVVDDDSVSRDLLINALIRRGFMADDARDGARAIKKLKKQHYDLILLDTTMPHVNGLQVLTWVHEQENLRGTPVLMMSTIQHMDIAARCLLMGADDFLLKPIDETLLICRIVGCLDKYANYLELKQSRAALNDQLQQAAKYIKTIMPQPIQQGPLHAQWYFEPSELLGGDILGYHWLDDHRFACFLLDVSGHGVEAAMLAETATHFLRGQMMGHVNYASPRQVLTALNQVFDSETHAGNFFTLWYGVINTRKQVMKYSAAGHPSALLQDMNSNEAPHFSPLELIHPPIGLLRDFKYGEAKKKLPDSFSLLVFSDGAYEIPGPDQRILGYTHLIEDMESLHRPINMDDLIERARRLNRASHFDDDVTILNVTGFHAEAMLQHQLTDD